VDNPVTKYNMGRFLTRHPAHVRRAQRLSLFCREVKRALINLCIDRSVSMKEIDYFMEDFFVNMEYHDLEYPLDTLLLMLLDEEFIEHTYHRYLERA
jgi:hypothetical protein